MTRVRRLLRTEQEKTYTYYAEIDGEWRAVACGLSESDARHILARRKASGQMTPVKFVQETS